MTVGVTGQADLGGVMLTVGATAGRQSQLRLPAILLGWSPLLQPAGPWVEEGPSPAGGALSLPTAADAMAWGLELPQVTVVVPTPCPPPPPPQPEDEGGGGADHTAAALPL